MNSVATDEPPAALDPGMMQVTPVVSVEPLTHTVCCALVPLIRWTEIPGTGGTGLNAVLAQLDVLKNATP